jgi:hypothetical protein
MELEKIALDDPYFIEKKLYPNVDFYSGIILSAIGFPTEMFTVLFALARTVGWIAQWNEMISDPAQKIGRPRQLYTGRQRQRKRRASWVRLFYAGVEAGKTSEKRAPCPGALSIRISPCIARARRREI